MHMLNLPLEILEMILRRLEIRSLISAMRTCSLLRDAGRKMLISWCQAHISEEVLDEIIDSIGGSFRNSEDYDWNQIFLQWSRFPVYAQKRPVNVIESYGLVCCIKQLSVAISGHFIFISLTRRSNVFIARGGGPYCLDFHEKYIKTPHKTCDNIKLINITCPDDLLNRNALITVSSEYVCVQNMSGQMLFLSDVKEPFSTEISVRTNRFAFYSKDTVTVCQIKLLKIEDGGVWDVSVTTVYEFKCQPLRTFQLCEDSVICISTVGSIIVHSISEAKMISTCHQATNVLRYPLTTVIHRGVIFCNLKMMKTMLNYWHIDMGQPEWGVWTQAVGFRSVSSKISADEEITTFAMKRTIIAAGTSKGSVAFYRHLGSDDEIVKTIERGPSFTINVTKGEPIVDLNFSVDNTFYMYVRTANNTLLRKILPIDLICN